MTRYEDEQAAKRRRNERHETEYAERALRKQLANVRLLYLDQVERRRFAAPGKGK